MEKSVVLLVLTGTRGHLFLDLAFNVVLGDGTFVGVDEARTADGFFDLVEFGIGLNVDTIFQQVRILSKLVTDKQDELTFSEAGIFYGGKSHMDLVLFLLDPFALLVNFLLELDGFKVLFLFIFSKFLDFFQPFLFNGLFD